VSLPTAAVRTLSIAGLLVLWAAAAALNGDPRVLPGPGTVLPRIWTEMIHGDLLFQLQATLLRVAAAFVLAMSIGAALGLLMGRRPEIDRWLDPWLVVFLNLPALVVIVLCYLWIGLNEVAAVVAVAINKIPTVTAMLREGARAMDPSLDAMAKVFRMDALSRFRHVILPQLAPHIASAARSGIALIWKIVLVVEFLGRSSGIGFKIHLYFQLFDATMVLVYALAFVAVMLAIEALVLQPFETRARAWRTA
jgi:NitT/TauT family transport system permease protein